jgi:hypothetical protein
MSTGRKIEVEAMFCTWCWLSDTNKSDRGRPMFGLLLTDFGCQRFRSTLLESHTSSQYHQDVNPSLMLAMQKASKVAFNKSLR